MRLKLISCDIFEREVKAAAARSRNQIDIEFLPKSPHLVSDPEKVDQIQPLIDSAGRSSYHAVLLVTGSCKQGLAGLTARSIPLVLPRAKDCISLLLQRPRPTADWPAMAQTASYSSTATEKRPAVRARPGGGTSYFVAPVKSQHRASCPGLSPTRNPWQWRERFNPVAPVPGMHLWRAGLTCSILEMLVNGYWNYSDFLVVAPNWRVVVNQDEGTIAAEELTP